MRVVVTGGRDFKDEPKVWNTLDSISEKTTITSIVEGGGAGVDTFARRWAQDRGVPCLTVFPAWQKYGKAAGPIRNSWMISQGHPTFAVIFPGGKGTKNMADLIIKAGIEHMIVV